MNPVDIQNLIDLLKETLKAHSDPNTRATLERFILILQGWLVTRPPISVAWDILGQILKWANGGRPVSGVIETAAKMVIEVAEEGGITVEGATAAGATSGGATAAGGFFGKTILGVEVGTAGVVAVVAFLLFALSLLGISIYRAATSPNVVVTSGAFCAPSAAENLGPISAHGILSSERYLFGELMNQAQSICDSKASNCHPTKPDICKGLDTCKPNASLQDFEITSYYLVGSEVTIKKFNCTCECLK